MNKVRYMCPVCLGKSRWFGPGRHMLCMATLVLESTLTQDPNKETEMSKFPTLSGNQAAFMACLLCQPPNTVRTDQLAKVLGCVPSAASNIGLQLRALNLVSSTNDNGQYNLWNATAYAKAMHEEQVRRAQNAAQTPAIPAGKKNEWILWSPQSPKPPVVRYSCEQEAMAVAESMAKRYPGQQFLCCEIHAGFKQVKVKREVVKVVEETKMEQI